MSEIKVRTVTIKPTDVDQTRPYKGLPDAGKFAVIPKRKFQVSHFIQAVTWNCVENTVVLEILETPAFSTFDWLNNINIIRTKLQKSPFCDLEQDHLTIQMFDDKDMVIGQVKLKGLELKSHECRLHKEKAGQPLVHRATIGYESLEVVPSELDQEAKDHPKDEWSREQYDLPPGRWDVKKTKEFVKSEHDII